MQDGSRDVRTSAKGSDYISHYRIGQDFIAGTLTIDDGQSELSTTRERLSVSGVILILQPILKQTVLVLAWLGLLAAAR